MKLPSLKTAAKTYALVWANRLECARILWLPLALVFLLAWIVWPYIRPCVNGGLCAGTLTWAPGRSAIVLALLLLLVFGVFIVLVSIMCAGLWRLWLRHVHVSSPFYLGFGGDELRLLAVAGVKGLLLLVWAVATAFVAALVEAIVVRFTGAFSPIAVLLTLIVAIFVLSWIATRLSLSGPATIKAQHVTFGASWRVTARNVARLQRVGALLMAPVSAFMLALLVALLLVFMRWLARSGLTLSDVARTCVLLLIRHEYLKRLVLLVLYFVLMVVAALVITARALEYEELDTP
ncbi:MAG TPA: hypothetical protein VFA27_10740 [Vicinamibacterales bacterium]|nr:hypothetical protein [Vicinamibacterales bacterium]